MAQRYFIYRIYKNRFVKHIFDEIFYFTKQYLISYLNLVLLQKITKITSMKYLNLLLFISIFTLHIDHIQTSTKETNTTSTTLTGKVIHIIDGDTYDLLIGNQIIRIRMEGIDAPEKGMPYYRVAKNYLATLCKEKTVTFKSTGKDIHDRYLGFTYIDDSIEVSHQMIKAGLAWHYKKYNSDKDLAELEEEAKTAKRGLWNNKNPIAPWKVRSMYRKGIKSKEIYGKK